MIEYRENIIDVNEYNELYDAVGWGAYDNNEIVETALKKSIYSVSAYEGNNIVGYGRIIGDETIFLYIQDVMVKPKYQNKKIGTNIMNKLLKKIEELKQINQHLRVYLGASSNKEEFYRKFGFITREENNLGKGMILK